MTFLDFFEAKAEEFSSFKKVLSSALQRVSGCDVAILFRYVKGLACC